MRFGEAVRSGFANSAIVSGRAARPAYWWWVLFAAIVNTIATALDRAWHFGGIATPTGTQGALSLVVSLALLLPGWAVFTRRMHDTDRSAWWWLLLVLPSIGWFVLILFLASAGVQITWLPLLVALLAIVGVIVLIVFLASPGTPGPNRYGPPPRGPSGIGDGLRGVDGVL